MNKDTKVCVHCKSEINKMASKCPHCGGKNYVWTLPRKILAGLLIGFVLLVIFNSNSSSPSSNTSNPVPMEEKLEVGEEGYLYSPSGNKIMVATSKASLEEATKLSVAGDTQGLAQMALNGQLFLAQGGTKVKIIDRQTFSRQVRITDGQFVGKSGWVPNEMIRKAK